MSYNLSVALAQRALLGAMGRFLGITRVIDDRLTSSSTHGIAREASGSASIQR